MGQKIFANELTVSSVNDCNRLLRESHKKNCPWSDDSSPTGKTKFGLKTAGELIPWRACYTFASDDFERR